MSAERQTSAGPAGLRRLEDLPGPPPLPILGNRLQLKRERIHRDVEAWSRRYGPMFRMQLGPAMVLGVADHETIHALLRQRPDTFRRGSQMRELWIEMGGAPGLFSAEGEAWRHQRRMVMAAFAPAHVRAFFPLLHGVAVRLRGRWTEAALAGAASDLQTDLKRYTVDAIAGLAFGTEAIPTGGDSIHRHLDKLLSGLFRRVTTPLPYWRWFRLPADRQLERSMEVVNAAIGRFIAQARQRLHDEPARRSRPPNLLEAMLVAADEGDSGVDDRDVAGNVSTMLFAGEDTTANTLAWMLWLLHRHPKALARARDEVRDAVPDAARADFDQIDGLRWIEACALEAMRLKPVAPFMVLEALHDTEVAGVWLPRGTLVWLVLRHDGLEERHFPRAQAFEPERWLAADDGGTVNRRATLPFGGGPRMCPGRYLALLEIKLAIATLLADFDIESVNTPDGGEAREVMTFTMNPVGLTMRLRLRQPTAA